MRTLIFPTLAALFAVSAAVAEPVAIDAVETRYKTKDDFQSISELFTGRESMPNVCLRTVPKKRDGMYFIVDFAWLKTKDLILGTQIEIDYVRSDDTQPRKAVFFLEETRSTFSEMQFGLTGGDWPDPTAKVLAYKVTVRDPVGKLLGEKASFLWNMPDAQREAMIAEGYGELLPNGKGTPKSDLKRPENFVVEADVAVGESAAPQKPRISEDKLAAIRASAERGEGKGLLALGVLYLKGIGVEQNADKAVEYLTRAAGKDAPRAHYNLALMYARGDGVAQNADLAQHYYTLAAKAGHVQAQYNLGYFYSYGGETTPNGKLAAEWYERAARQGYAPAQYNLAFLLTRGDAGLTVDFPQAYYWALIARQNKQAGAQGLVRKLTGLVDKAQQADIEAAAKAFVPAPEASAESSAPKADAAKASAPSTTQSK